ncbi:16S rRNA (cytosine(1402)-N(4))-methyltransferase [Candidatus Uhrbacteria bacterium CG_4_10_14_0_8_um_filter_58_22]|uniref:Ribosomal RNA small subunit methyltransferase H n=1 Tax=Candidatus Uhrbacteria bacterium CG_4_10_14_0_8_um_filter_58_22 TaxID=1975029 RepID=A0A2M7QC07_9BACT|nr:MAG: 16S rRNA (cytosine(1402)-N(4))-methyltransferase [Parcubacteria group bacterium CG1_02_58_44]PIY63321.1 MAG: 16S rRNA (cytosine(1402)-N(4))-methyltransferase [Candidatus Uhrbacteria bacterium CG_4_10_14_0_8_um_filter_58_22]
MADTGGETKRHQPVLLNETVEALQLQSGTNVVDCTVGAGGHAMAVLSRTVPDGRLLGLDLDETALETARRNLDVFGSRAMLVRANYRDVEKILLSTSFGSFQAAVLDLGFSSLEIDDPTRGFSFRFDGPLDMRYDRMQELTAAEIVNSWPEGDLLRILVEYGEERYASRIVRAIRTANRGRHIVSASELAEVVRGAVPGGRSGRGIHPATKTFQALRIAVNDELGNLRAGLEAIFRMIDPGGRVAVISFHSLEDRIVKRFFLEKGRRKELTVVTRRPLVPTEDEVGTNSRSRSAKLRVAIKS